MNRNSLDAGANNVEIKLINNGLQLVEVNILKHFQYY